MSEVTHKIFSQDVEVGYLVSKNGKYQLHPFKDSSLFIKLKPLFNGLEIRNKKPSFLIGNTIADCLKAITSEYAVIAISDVDAYLNPNLFTLTERSVQKEERVKLDDSVLLDEIKADFKAAPTDRLTEIYCHLDAELKYRANRDRLIRSSGLNRWSQDYTMGHR